jgi:hypothetical protein
MLSQFFFELKTNRESIPGRRLIHLFLLNSITPTNLKPESLCLIPPIRTSNREVEVEHQYRVHCKTIASPLETILKIMGIGMSFAETPIPLIPIQINTLGSRLVLDLLVKVTNLGTLGSCMEGMQSLGIVIHNKPPNIRASFPIGKDIGQCQRDKSKDFGELHWKVWCRTPMVGKWVGLLVRSRDIQERH